MTKNNTKRIGHGVKYTLADPNILKNNKNKDVFLDICISDNYYSIKDD